MRRCVLIYTAIILSILS